MVLIYVEGLPWAGKSTIIKALEESKKSVIHELGRVLSKNEFPWNWKTTQEIHEIDTWFIEKENLRYKPGWENNKNGSNIFFDRSFLSHLSYGYAYGILKWLPSFPWTIKLYDEAIKNNKVLIPDFILNISVSPELSIERQLQRTKDNPTKALPEFRRNNKFLNDILYWYSKLFPCLSSITLDIDWRLPTKEQIDFLLNFWFEQKNHTKIDLQKYLDSLR